MVEQLIKELSETSFDNHEFDYKIVKSIGCTDIYNKPPKEAAALHLQHICADNREDGWSVVACCGKVEGNNVIGSFILCRRKEQ